jgi:small subunit ribosomal protein S6e
MAEFKLVMGLKDGKSVQRVIKDEQSHALMGKMIRDTIKGEDIGLAGYEFEITGGSDYCGFPMRRDVQGTGRKKILVIRSVGMQDKGKGLRKRKTVAGNTIYPRTAQINLKVLKEGKAKLTEEAAEAKDAGAQPEKKEDKPSEAGKKPDTAEDKK